MKCFLIDNLTENKLPIIIMIQKEGQDENQAGLINDVKIKTAIFLFFDMSVSI